MAGGGQHHHDQGQAPDQRQLGSHQHSQAGHERQRGIRPGPSPVPARRLRPAHHHPPDQAQPGGDQTVLQTGGGEVAGRRERDVDQCPGRQDHSGRSLQRRRVQPRGTEDHHRHAGDAEEHAQRQGDVLQAHRATDHAAQVDQVGPRGGGVGLHPLTDVEHRAVTGQQVADGAQDDQAVVGDPAALPDTPGPQGADHDDTGPEGEPGQRMAGERGTGQQPRQRAGRAFGSARIGDRGTS